MVFIRKKDGKGEGGMEAIRLSVSAHSEAREFNNDDNNNNKDQRHLLLLIIAVCALPENKRENVGELQQLGYKRRSIRRSARDL